MLYITGIIITFFLALLLLSKRDKSFADKILVSWLIVIGVHLLLYYMRGTLGDIRFTFLLGIELPFPLLHGPLLYLYAAALTYQLPVDKRKVWAHFVPPILSCFLFSAFFLLPAEQKIEVYKKAGAGFEPQMLINQVAIYLSGIIYVTWSSILLLKHKKNIATQFSNTEKINLNWLRYLVYGTGVIWVFVLVGEDVWIFGAVTFFVMLLGFFGIRQVGIFTNQNYKESLLKLPLNKHEVINQRATDTIDILPENEMLLQQPYFTEPSTAFQEQTEPSALLEDSFLKKKYLKSGLTEEMASDLHDKLNKLMDAEKIYTESKLSLSELANRLETLPNYLSQVINEKEGKNFYDYINTLRIEEFKRLISIPENQKFTIVSLSYDCGFNSKSPFNKNFKKATGQSPSEYLHSLNIETA